MVKIGRKTVTGGGEDSLFIRRRLWTGWDVEVRTFGSRVARPETGKGDEVLFNSGSDGFRW